MPDDPLYSFVFRGLLTEEALDRTGRIPRESFSSQSESDMAARLGIPLLDDSLVSKSKKMSIIYVAISSFENSVREFIERKLLEEKGENWWDDCVKKDIRDRATQRREAENGIRWLTPRGNSMIYYSDFGDLVSIMAGNLTFFEPHIGNIEWAKQIITTLERSRHVIMHSGELLDADIERIGMYIRDWIRQVG